MAERRRRAMIAAGVGLAVVVVGAGVAWAGMRGSGPSYRLATVTRGNVSQTVTEVGTIASASSATLAFPVSGTVQTVRVKTGDRVAAGQTVATLDTTQLQAAVDAAQSTLADAKQRLADDEDGQSSTASVPSSSAGAVRQIALVTPLARPSARPTSEPSAPASGTGGSASGAAGGSASSLGAAKAALVQAQRAVTSAQARLDALLQDSVVATACRAGTVTFSTVSDADGVVSGTVTGADGLPVALLGGTDAAGAPVPPSTVRNGRYSFGSAADPLKAGASYTVQLGDESNGLTVGPSCASALGQVKAATAALEKAIGALENAVNAYARAAGTSGGASGGTSGQGGSSSRPSGGVSAGSPRSPSAAGGRTGTSGGSGTQTPSGTGTVASAQQIAADQKTIDAARAELAVARQNRAQAVLTTPIAGTVATVALSAGQAVSAGSPSATIMVIGPGQKKIETTVGIADIDLVRQGDPVRVTVDGVTGTIPGRVTTIGILNSTGTSGTTTTYPVTVLLDTTTRALYDGAGATLAIDVGSRRNVLTVPISAVHTAAFGSVVDVYRDGKITAARVRTGIRGVDAVEVTSGLQAGQQVVLAVVSEPIPSNSKAPNGRRGAGLFGDGGARFVGGGPGGR
jgi:multidrug efflux pump subunit AcrA (membrane-fusion protein)